MFAFFPRCRPTFFLPIINPSKSVDSPLSFALLGDLLSLIFLLLGHFCSQELCCLINQVDFSIAPKQNLEIKDKPVFPLES